MIDREEQEEQEQEEQELLESLKDFPIVERQFKNCLNVAKNWKWYRDQYCPGGSFTNVIKKCSDCNELLKQSLSQQPDLLKKVNKCLYWYQKRRF